MGLFSNLFGGGQKVSMAELIAGGAKIIDVRTKGEFQQGHLKNSINIPLDQLEAGIKKIAKNQTIITCCASGMRSGAAKSKLKSMGYESVHNGGSWLSLKKHFR